MNVPASIADPPSEPSEPSEPDPPPDQRLHRCRDRRIIAGVAAGVADYLDIDPTLVRIGFVALALLGGLAVPVYLSGWLLIPGQGAELSMAEELLDHDRVR
jgi:phage shock protein C